VDEVVVEVVVVEVGKVVDVGGEVVVEVVVVEVGMVVDVVVEVVVVVGGAMTARVVEE